MQAPSQAPPEAVAAAAPAATPAPPEPGLLAKALDAAASARASYPGLGARVLGSLVLPLLALGLGATLLRLVGRPLQWGLDGDTLLVLPLLLGQAAALWHGFVGGAVFARGVRPFTVLAGLALGVWLLLILEPQQRHTLQAALTLSRGTPWEGLASGLSWAVLACAVPLVALAGLLLWRMLAQAVLEARVAVSAALDLMWVLCVSALCVVLWALVAPLGLPGAPSLELGGKAWAVAAQRLSLFVDGPATVLLIFSVMYAGLRLGLGWLQSDRRRAAAAALKTLPPLVVLDLRQAHECPPRATRDLHALASTWGQARGPVLLLRAAAQALHGAGQHARWAQAARRLSELFVSGADAARRWCATWLAPGSGPFVRECLLGQGGDLREMVLALRSATPSAFFLLLPGSWLASDEIERLRLALPKSRTLCLVSNEAGAAALERVASLQGQLRLPWQRQALVTALTQRLQAQPRQQRLAVIGRPRSDRLADAVVAAVDQQRLAGDEEPVDAQRPARDAQGGFDRLLLLIDPAWLTGEAEAEVEAAALQALVRSVLAAAAGEPGRVAFMSTDATDAAPTRQAAARAWALCGGAGAVNYLGPLPGDPATWAAQGALQRLFGGGEVPLAEDVDIPEAPPPLPATGQAQAVHRQLSDFRFCAYLSYAMADDRAWSGWVESFGRELEIGLQAQLRGVKLPPLYRSGSDGPVAGSMVEALGERLAAAFALIIVVHDHYAQSEWCLKELELFAAQRPGTAWQQQVYVVALSQPAVESVTRSPHWKQLMQGQDMLWLPFYDAQAHERPLAIYGERGIVSPQFREPFMRLRQDFAQRLRQAAALPPPGRPGADAAAGLRIYIESSREQPRLWEDLGEQLRRLWDELQGSWDPASSQAPPLRPRMLLLEAEQLPPLGDADGVVLLVGAKPPKQLLEQIETLESHLPSGRLPGLLVADASVPSALDTTALAWPLLTLDLREGAAAAIARADPAALNQFLRQVWERHLLRREA